MIHYKTNFDFEYQLIGLKNKNLNTQLEPLFLWCCNPHDVLITNQNYLKSFLEKIEQARDMKLYIEKDQGQRFSNWWGSLDNLENARRLNSNWIFHRWLQSNNYHQEKISFYESFNEQLDYNFLYKKEFGVSGRSFLHKIKEPQDKIIKMPKLVRKEDYSLIFHKDKHSVFLKHAIDKNFSWRGVEKTTKYFDQALSLAKKWSDDFNSQEIFSLDFFTYELEGKEKLFFSEINYRKTMGAVYVNLIKQFPKANKLIFSYATPKSSLFCLTNIQKGANLYLV